MEGGAVTSRPRPPESSAPFNRADGLPIETARLLDAAEVADLLNIPERWVREATRAGKLPCVVLGKYRRYDRDDVLRWVEEQKSGGAPMQFRRHVPVPQGGTK